MLSDQRIGAVVSCVGIWTGTVEQFELVQYTVPVALFDACGQLGIRVVHLSALGHPCVGDPLYGSDPVLAARLGLERQWLHAVELSFAHPLTGELVTFTSAYPDDLTHALEALR